MSTSIIISYKYRDKSGQKAIPNVNPNATDAELYNFANDLLALSAMTFTGAKKVTTTELSASEVNNDE